MTDPDDPTYRSHHAATDVRLAIQEDEEMMSLRLPIASTGEVRNEGDDPLTREELEGMATQVNDLTTGVFPDHGDTDIVAGGMGYSQFDKLGYWADGEVEAEAAADDADVLMATARMPDPETLPAATGDYRTALAILKEQAERDIPIDASIGWREDEGYPGGVDLMEASVVGIGADPRTSSEAAAPVAAMTRAAVEAGADPDELVAAVRATLRDDGDTPDDARPLGPPGDRDRFETFEECVATLAEDDDVSEADAEEICGAWEQASGEQSMSDDDSDPPEDTGDTTDEAQDADDGETTERADEECPECGHDVRDGANYCSDCGHDLREDDEDDESDDDESDEQESDDEDMDGDDEDDEEEEDTQEGDDEDDDEDDEDDDTQALKDEVADLREQLDEIRAGGLEADDLDTPDADEERDTEDDAEPTDDRHELTDKYGIQ